MFGKQKVASVYPPDGWSDAMLSEFVGKRRGVDGATNVLLMIDEVQKHVELLRSSLDEQVCFTARVAAKEGSPLAFVRANIRFSEVQTYGRAGAVPLESVGFLFFSQSEQIGGGPRVPLVEVVLFGGNEGQSRLERYLADTQLFGNEFVPLWIWLASIESLPTSASEALEFSINNQLPVSKCDWQQILHLGSAVPQDDLLL